MDAYLQIGQCLGCRRWRPTRQVPGEKDRHAAQRVPMLRRHQGGHEVPHRTGSATLPSRARLRGQYQPGNASSFL